MGRVNTFFTQMMGWNKTTPHPGARPRMAGGYTTDSSGNVVRRGFTQGEKDARAEWMKNLRKNHDDALKTTTARLKALGAVTAVASASFKSFSSKGGTHAMKAPEGEGMSDLMRYSKWNRKARRALFQSIRNERQLEKEEADNMTDSTIDTVQAFQSDRIRNREELWRRKKIGNWTSRQWLATKEKVFRLSQAGTGGGTNSSDMSGYKDLRDLGKPLE